PSATRRSTRCEPMNPAPPVTRTELNKRRLNALRPRKLSDGHRELAPLRAEARAALLERGSSIRVRERHIVRVENQVDPTPNEHRLEVVDRPQHRNTRDATEAL